MIYSDKRAKILPQRSRRKMPNASMKFANGIPSVVTLPAGFTPLLPHHEVIRTIRNHGKGVFEEDDYISVSLEQSRQLEQFYSLEVIRRPPPPAPVAPVPVQASVSSPIPMSIITPGGKKENVIFYAVQTEDMIALEQVFDILSEIFRIMMLYELKDAVMVEVEKMPITVSSDLKPMTKTVEDCLNHLDKIQNDVNADILQTLLKTLLIVKTDLFSWWPLVGIVEVEQEWDKVVDEIVKEILDEERKKEQPVLMPPPFEVDFVHHFCSFINPVVDLGDFNADEVREALKANYERLVNDPNTVFV